jgi:hypothetical protein
VQEMVVSWDAMSLMRQLRMLPTLTTDAAVQSSSHTPAVKSSDGTIAGTTSTSRQNSNARAIPSNTKPTNGKASVGAPNGARATTTNTGTGAPTRPPAALSSSAASALRVKLSSKQTEALCRRLGALFARESHGDAVTIAHEVLDDRCLFLDSNMGGRFTGRTQCIRYVERLRGPFPKFVVKGMNTSALTSQANGDSRVQVGWAVDAVYDGQLVKAPKACRFNGVLFVCFSGASGKIREVHMSWNATSLMQQLGVIAE